MMMLIIFLIVIEKQEWVVTLLVLFGLTNFFFTITWLKDPGYLRKSEQVSFLRLVEKFDPNMLCPSCEVICTTESRHCYICNRCVERFDHHCQWINNCIGVQ
jgi:palmitoyltransferase